MARQSKNKYPPKEVLEGGKVVRLRQRISARNFAQEQYLESLRNSPVTISNGPAGSGKTFIVTAVALEKLLDNEIDKIVFTRPVVETEEQLGFLPGTLEQKLDPYLKPLFDAVEDHVGPTMAKKLLESGRIEIAPLAYMRGRTFNHCYVVLDEAQNSTVRQMKMFLTRMGEGSYFTINGDSTQSDLKPPRDADRATWEHGLDYVVRKLKAKDRDIQYIEFFHNDVVRSDMCKRVLELLDSPDERRERIDRNETSKPTRHSFSDPVLLTEDEE